MASQSISERWSQVVDRVANAALKSQRSAHEVTIVGVTKYVDCERARELYQAGCRDFGESRPQSLWEKSAALRDLSIRWHLIGHLQRNKSQRTLPIVHSIHSVDSLRLARQLERDACEIQRSLPILLEVNISEEGNKTGMRPEELLSSAAEIVNMPHLRVLGLMGMAGLGNQEPRTDFVAIRQLRDRLQAQLGPTVRLDELSMGMSGDFEEAIEEGATIVRLGSILFPS